MDVEVFKAYQSARDTGDTKTERKLLDKLVRDNMKLVHHFVHQLLRKMPHLSQEDLVQEGCCGLVEAFQTYDEARGAFASWAAYAMRGRLMTAARSDALIYRPRDTGYMPAKVRKDLRASGVKIDTTDDASLRAFAERHNVPLARARRWLEVDVFVSLGEFSGRRRGYSWEKREISATHRAIAAQASKRAHNQSLEGSESSATVGDGLASMQMNPERAAQAREQLEWLADAIHDLTEREQDLLFSLVEGAEPSELAKKWGWKPDSIRALRQKVISSLAETLAGEGL